MEKIHFIGIGGLSMRALADIMFKRGYEISGTDKNNPIFFEKINYFYQQNYSQIPDGVTTVVFNNIIPNDHPEIIDAKKRNLRLIPRSVFLNDITNDRFKILMTGTDGKTSTSYYISQLCEMLNIDPFSIIGGKISDDGKTYRIGSGPYIVEQNEGDLPNCVDSCDLLVFTNFDQKDHIWDFGYSKELYFKLYKQLLHQAKQIIYNIDDIGVNVINSEQRGISFGRSDNADFRISDINETTSSLNFKLNYQNKQYHIETHLHGKFSAYNVTAAIIAVYQLHNKLDEIIAYTNKLKHSDSRFEIVYQDDKKTIYSSIHGSGKSLEQVIDSLKKYNKDISILVNFNETRGKIFFDEFYEVLKNYRFGCFAESYIAQNATDAIRITTQDDFNKFIDDSHGIVVLAHAKYCFHDLLKNYLSQNKIHNI
jgi:UDP-N-acetylmuramate--alanine ligase